MKGAAIALLLGASLFGDDFESGTLLTTDTPPGQWDVLDPTPMTMLSATLAAAHRGDAGLLLVDNYADAGPAENGNVRKSLAASANAYARVWMKLNVTSTGGVGDIEPLTLRETSSNQDLATLQVFPDGGMQLSGWDQMGYTFTPVAGLITGGWQLIELAALNVGTNNGQRRVWIDGHPAATATERWNGRVVDHFVLGGTWENDSRWTGTVSYDDLRIEDGPQMSTILPTLDAGALGDCIRVHVDMVDSDGLAAPTPYALTLAVARFGPIAGPFQDAACSVGVSLGVPPGIIAVDLYFRSMMPGAASIGVSHADFLSTPVFFTVVGDGGADAGLATDAGVADAGTPDGGEGDAGTNDAGFSSSDGGVIDGGAPDAGGPSVPLIENVACGCSTGEGALTWLALSWMLRRARRPRQS
jgi:hypothetical protein